MATAPALMGRVNEIDTAHHLLNASPPNQAGLVLPLPAEAKVSVPGFAFASAISSLQPV